MTRGTFFIAGLAILLGVVAVVRFRANDAGAILYPRIEARLIPASGALDCELTLRDANRPRYVVEFVVPRGAREVVELGVPGGFREEALVEPEAHPGWTRTWNQENVRFVGELRLEPDQPVRLRFPVRGPVQSGFTLNGRFESERRFRRTVSFFSATL